MTALLEKKISWDTFFELELPANADYYFELIDGQFIKRNTPSGEHQFTQTRLLRYFMQFVYDKGLGEVFSSPTAVLLDANNIPIPDLVFLSNAKMDRFSPKYGIEGAPDLVVEIVSPSSFKMDRFEKRDSYLNFGVIEYWVVDTKYKSVEVHILKENRYELYSFVIEEGTVQSTVLEGFILEIQSIFAV